MFGLAKVLGNIERTALRSVCKPCLCTLNLVAVRMYTPVSVRRSFLIPYVYRSKSFNIHTDSGLCYGELMCRYCGDGKHSRQAAG